MQTNAPVVMYLSARSPKRPSKWRSLLVKSDLDLIGWQAQCGLPQDNDAHAVHGENKITRTSCGTMWWHAITQQNATVSTLLSTKHQQKYFHRGGADLMLVNYEMVTLGSVYLTHYTFFWRCNKSSTNIWEMAIYRPPPSCNTLAPNTDILITKIMCSLPIWLPSVDPSGFLAMTQGS